MIEAKTTNIEGVKFEDTTESLEAIAELVGDDVRVDYADKENPVLRVGGVEFHPGDYVLRLADGEIAKAEADAIIERI